MGKNKNNSKKSQKVEDTFEPILQEFKEEYEITAPGSQCMTSFSFSSFSFVSLINFF